MSYSVKLTDMQRVAEAMRVLHILVNCNGRRLLNLELASKARWVTWNPDSPMLTVRMAPRAMRRQLQKDQFRPVYGYMGPPRSRKPSLNSEPTEKPRSVLSSERQQYERDMAEQLRDWRNE